MHLGEATDVIRKTDAIWPMGEIQSDDTRAEWISFLLPLDYDTACESLVDMRNDLKWHPAMSEFREAYNVVVTRGASHLDSYAVTGGEEDVDYGETLRELYGSSRNDWVYCYRCDMAVTLEERSGEPTYAAGHGFRHAKCPKEGLAPMMPAWRKLEREERKAKRPRSRS